MIKAKGHTNGNSIIIVEDDGLFYMLHGDITYIDEALYKNKLSVVYDDKEEARKMGMRGRELAEKLYNIKRCAAQIEEAINEK